LQMVPLGRNSSWKLVAWRPFAWMRRSARTSTFWRPVPFPAMDTMAFVAPACWRIPPARTALIPHRSPTGLTTTSARPLGGALFNAQNRRTFRCPLARIPGDACGRSSEFIPADCRFGPRHCRSALSRSAAGVPRSPMDHPGGKCRRNAGSSLGDPTRREMAFTLARAASCVVCCDLTGIRSRPLENGWSRVRRVQRRLPVATMSWSGSRLSASLRR
jgi:hypothetical protein